jgi:hypothetical protein
VGYNFNEQYGPRSIMQEVIPYKTIPDGVEKRGKYSESKEEINIISVEKGMFFGSAYPVPPFSSLLQASSNVSSLLEKINRSFVSPPSWQNDDPGTAATQAVSGSRAVAVPVRSHVVVRRKSGGLTVRQVNGVIEK